MALAVSQQAFNETVQENIEEFGMSPEEAIEDTVKQLEAQGIDLSNIVKELALSDSMDFSELAKLISAFGVIVKEGALTRDETVQCLKNIRLECEKDLQHRVAAGKEGVYDMIFDLIDQKNEDFELVGMCLATLATLMIKQPDLLDDRGVNYMVKTFREQPEEMVTRNCLKWTRECCILHERNRQKIFDAAILDHLKLILSKKNLTAGMLQDVLGVLRALVLDDDIRVEFGKAHDHARAIASDALCTITGLLTRFKDNENVMHDLMLTLSALLVRAEFCKKVCDAGALPIIHDALITFTTNGKIIRQCMKLLKALAGNDECKHLIISGGNGPNIVTALGLHTGNAQTAVFGLGCVAALALRSPENSKVLFDAGVSNVIVEAMKAHPDNEDVQKYASWAIRNLVSRSKDQCTTFLELGAEALLKQNLKKFPKSEYDIKSALRDLGCNVDFKEEWTGKGGKLNTQAKK